MTPKPTVKIDPEDIVRYLIYQQFYYGDDIIYGRTKDRSEHIEGAGKAIDDFYELITDNIDLIDSNNHRQYLESYNKNIHAIDINLIMEKYLNYKETLGEDMERKMTLSVIFGECLEQTQSMSFETSILALIDFILEKRDLSFENEKDIKKSIKALYGKNNPNIGMIYSLSFMKFIAKTIKNKVIEKKSEELLQKHYQIIELIL